MNNPFDLLSLWIAEEQQKGAPNPQHAVLATISEEYAPHSRVLAIREIKNQQLVFFTQKGTRKFYELMRNPQASLTFWFELFQREVILEGSATPLSQEENNLYWQNYPREAQIRFHSYAPTSSKPITSKIELENKKKKIASTYDGEPIPVSPFYVGFKFTPIRIVFYCYRLDELSDVLEYRYEQNSWQKQLLSP